MSYILDALRKADAQRVRDPARGIHAQAAAAPATAATPLRNRSQWLWAAVAVVILAAAAWLWFSAGDKAPPPEVAVAAAPAAAPVAAPRVAAPAAVVLPAAPPVAVAAAPEVRRPPAPSPQKEKPPAPPPVVTAAPAAAADRVYSVAELPADVRQALPKLAISGGVYSENVAQRMLVVGGQVFNEGSEIAPGVALEQIRPKSVLLKFRGLRITLAY